MSFPGAAAQALPGAAPQPALGCQAGLLVPGDPATQPLPVVFASWHLPCSAEHEMAASWAQEKRLLCFSNKDPACAAKHGCGTSAVASDRSNPQRPCVKEGSKSVVTQGHVTAHTSLFVAALGTLIKLGCVVGERALLSPRPLLGSCNHENT